MTNFGRLVKECPLVAVLGRSVQEHPLQAGLGRFVWECPKEAIHELKSGSQFGIINVGLLGGKFGQITLKAPHGASLDIPV